MSQGQCQQRSRRARVRSGAVAEGVYVQQGYVHARSPGTAPLRRTDGLGSPVPLRQKRQGPRICTGYGLDEKGPSEICFLRGGE